MASEALINVIERQDLLEQASEAIQPAVTNAFKAAGPAGQEVKNFLYGTWLGHPLHPVLTDVPMGAWTGVPVLLVRRGGEIHALAHTCSHLGGPLSKGKLEGEIVQCPWHGSRFSIKDGSVVDGPATFPQPCFETRVRDGQIEVRSTR
jgi:nitrite reductase/ring-hydroxylating ferredoxin subunit